SRPDARVFASRCSADLQSLRLGQQQYPLHPAARQLPGELQMLSSLSDQRPQRIALTLPLSGPLSSAGAPIRDGFLASYYADPQRLESSIQIEIDRKSTRLN